MKSIKLRILLLLINYIFVGTRFFSIKNTILRFAGVKLHRSSKVVGPIYFGSKIEIEIGENCWIGRCANFDGNGYIKIGNNVDLAPHLLINTGGHLIGGDSKRAGNGIENKVIIGNGCWIGTRTTIINNVNIGSGSIVAAGALINKDINSNVLVGGVPAKLIKNLD